uniref:Large ribosomal subunit protein bL12c n=1 Tax=Melanthalia intermedia TaxID=172989 RepID=A0A345UB00_9FLOR|nr:ribosomal protein L12 [Melanthalia intermedia]AXI97636.1 ribosomal protein L12 [Melanthalia intermedia]
MNNKIIEIINSLKSLSLLEASKLVKEIEKTFDVETSYASQSNTISMLSGEETSNSDEKNEQTEFNLILEEVPSAKKIAILKVVRSITGLGLKEAKNLVESSPKTVKEGATKEASEEMKKKLEEAGAKVSIK